MMFQSRCAVLFIAVSSLALLGTACSSREEATKAECVRNMELIWDMASIYRMEHGTNADFIFTPRSLMESHSKTYYRCPLGTNDYPPFTYASGPRCANAAVSHAGARSPERSGFVK